MQRNRPARSQTDGSPSYLANVGNRLKGLHPLLKSFQCVCQTGSPNLGTAPFVALCHGRRHARRALGE
eukprot:9476827-Pyramimonas_sp.AAC.1